MSASSFLNGYVAIATLCILGLLFRAWRRQSRQRHLRRIENRLDRV